MIVFCVTSLKSFRIYFDFDMLWFKYLIKIELKVGLYQIFYF